MGFLVSQKIDFKSCFQTWKLADRPTGRPDRSTEVHSHVHVVSTVAGRPGRSTDQESLLSGNVQSTDPVDRQFKSRRAVDWQSTGPESSALWKLSVDRAGRPVAATVRKMTVGRSTGGRPTALTGSQRLYFLKPINWDLVNCF